MRKLLLLPILALVACQPTSSEEASLQRLYVGTYTKKEGHVDGKADGIHSFDLANGVLTASTVDTGIINPSYLAIDDAEKMLYAVSEIGSDVDSSGQVVAYRIQENGSLQEVNRQPTYGFAPCYLSLHPTGDALFVANYVGGTIAVYPRLPDGSLGVASQTITLEGSGPHPEQEAAHPHCIIPSPNGEFVYVADKGTDRVSGFRWDKQGKMLQPLEPAFTQLQAGAGPRHLAFHPQLPYLYLINELNSTVNVLAYAPETGKLNLQQNISTLPEDYQGPNAGADIHLSPDGRSLYASNRGHNSLALFQLEANGRLSPNGFVSTAGEIPRNFLITADGQRVYVANQNSDNIVLFSRDGEKGSLKFLQEFPCPTPVCLKMYAP